MTAWPGRWKVGPGQDPGLCRKSEDPFHSASKPYIAAACARCSALEFATRKCNAPGRALGLHSPGAGTSGDLPWGCWKRTQPTPAKSGHNALPSAATTTVNQTTNVTVTAAAMPAM